MCYYNNNTLLFIIQLERCAIIMSKHAYTVVYESLPTSSSSAVYFDSKPIILPYAEDFPKLHYHDRYELGICTDGDGLFLSNGIFSTVSTGDLIFIAPEICHYSRSLSKEKPCCCRFAYVNKKMVDELIAFISFGNEDKSDILKRATQNIPTVLHCSDTPTAANTLRELMDGCQSNDYENEALTLLRLVTFLLETNKIPSCTVTPPPLPQNSDQTVTELAEYLALNYEKNISSKELALHFHLSESQLRRKFTASYGIPPIAYRNRLRCRIAATLLSRSRLSVTEISERIGYKDLSDFYRHFKKYYKCSPTAYRMGKNT